MDVNLLPTRTLLCVLNKIYLINSAFSCMILYKYIFLGRRCHNFSITTSFSTNISTSYRVVCWDCKVHQVGEITSDVELKYVVGHHRSMLLMYSTSYLQGSGAPTKKVRKSERSTPVARIVPTRIDSLKKLSEGQSIYKWYDSKENFVINKIDRVLWQIGFSKTANIWCCCQCWEGCI